MGINTRESLRYPYFFLPTPIVVGDYQKDEIVPSLTDMGSYNHSVTLAKKSAPVRYCLKCGCPLQKDIKTKQIENDHCIVAVVYGKYGSGYWCSSKCIKFHTPVLVNFIFALIGVMPEYRRKLTKKYGFGSRTLLEAAINFFKETVRF